METTRPLAKLAIAMLLVAATTVTSPRDVLAQSGTIRSTSGESTVSHNISKSIERLEMLVKSSRILTLEERIPKFQVHNEEVLGATPVSQNQIQIFAKTPGTTQLNLWDTNDKLYTVDVIVLADAREVEGILSTQLPFASLKVLPVNQSAIVSGSVTSVDDVDRAVAIVEQFYTTVVNNIKVVGVQQVLLHTRIMEVSRTKFRDLGVDLAILNNNNLFVNAPSNLINATATTLAGAVPEAGGAQIRIFTGDFEALIAALRQEDLIKFLAEPTVVATHGRPARFTVGGKVPYIIPSGNNSVTIAYEEYGTSVDFLPFVVGPGRIRLEVRPEVTEPDNSRSIEASGIVVPAFSQRYVETAVELQAGQTFAIAGLLQSRTESSLRATPFFGEIPYIGAVFRRVTERRNDIELLITVTPELVDAMNPHEVPAGGPGLNSMSPNDWELYMKGHIEVPNLLGSDGHCETEGFSSFSGVGGQVTYSDQAAGNVGLPPDAIVPGASPTVVGDGVIISAPAE
jgi:pilus assembly protein CpaC